MVKEHQVASPGGEPDPYTSKHITYLCTSSGVVTVSIGLSTYDGSVPPDRLGLIHTADQALYRAKVSDGIGPKYL